MLIINESDNISVFFILKIKSNRRYTMFAFKDDILNENIFTPKSQNIKSKIICSNVSLPIIKSRIIEINKFYKNKKLNVPLFLLFSTDLQTMNSELGINKNGYVND